MLFSKIESTSIQGASVPLSKLNTPRLRTESAPAPGSLRLRGVPLGLLAALALVPGLAGAAGLGRLTVQSSLGQPLRAEVDVPAVARDEAPSLQIKLAPQAAFRQANLDYSPALTQLRFELQPRDEGSYVVSITSAQPVSEPYLDLLLELSWASGRVLREYTVLLDPPAMHQAPVIVAPAATEVVPAPEPVSAAPASQPAAVVAAPPPAMVPAPEPAPAPAPVATAPAPVPVPSTAAARQPMQAPRASAAAAPAPAPAPVRRARANYKVQPGDTLGRIASENRAGSVSLDQMLVALVRANPGAFIDGNMNRLLAGRTLAVPSADEAQAIETGEARREVSAQSADFASYRARLAQAVAAAPAPAAPPSSSTGQGRVTTRVEDKGAPSKTGDQLKIAANAAARDEAVARQKALKAEQAKAAELRRLNEEVKKANELAAREAARAQKEAEAKRKADEAKKAAEEKALAARQAEEKKAADLKKAAEEKALAARQAEEKKQADAAARQQAEDAAKKNTEVAAATPVAPQTPVAAPAAPATPPEAPAAPGGPSLWQRLGSPLGLVGLVAALSVALFGFNVWRRRRVEGSDSFRSTGDGTNANSLFGATGGQSVDTRSTSSFNSSFIPAASQLDSNEVDPVAEADVYIAYGREEQAEDLLKEALRLQPDRPAVRMKLLEIYARRADKASFNAVAQDIHERSAGGEDWERAAKLGRALDPDNPLYAAGTPAGMEVLARGPTTELRLNPVTVGRPATLGGAGEAARAEGSGRTVLPLPPTVIGLAAAAVGAAAAAAQPAPADKAAPEPSQAAGTDAVPLSLPQLSVPDAGSDAAHEPLARTDAGIDFGALDFDLGPTRLDAPPATPPVHASAGEPAGPVEHLVAGEPPEEVAPTLPGLDLAFPPLDAPVAAAASMPHLPLPDVDLELRPHPAAAAAAIPAAAAQPVAQPAEKSPPAGAGARANGESGTHPGEFPLSSLEEVLSRPSVLGVAARPEDFGLRLTANTDQATVPLIDFDLSGGDALLTGRRTETPAGSPIATQMATKLDLARGYIDLGVKDGARELLEEVMKDGTREQRQQAVELIRMVEA